MSMEDSTWWVSAITLRPATPEKRPMIEKRAVSKMCRILVLVDDPDSAADSIHGPSFFG